MWNSLIMAALSLGLSDGLSVSASQIPDAPELRFRAGYAIHGNGSWVVEFYSRHKTSGETEWVIRRSLFTPTGREQVQWATDGACPVIVDIVDSVNLLSLGQPWVPTNQAARVRQFVYPAPQMPRVHGDSYSIWGIALQRGAFVDYKIDTASGDLSDWVRAADTEITKCLTE